MSLIKKSDLKYDYNWSTSGATKPLKSTTESGPKTELFSIEQG